MITHTYTFELKFAVALHYQNVFDFYYHCDILVICIEIEQMASCYNGRTMIIKWIMIYNI